MFNQTYSRVKNVTPQGVDLKKSVGVCVDVEKFFKPMAMSCFSYSLNLIPKSITAITKAMLLKVITMTIMKSKTMMI